MNTTATLQLVRNATLKICYAGHVILVDPVLAEKETFRSALGVNKNPRVHLTMPVSEVIEGLDMVLLTHNHIDHYEPSVKGYLPKSIRFFTQPQAKNAVESDGFVNVEAIDEVKRLNGLDIFRMSGHHGRGKLADMMGPVSGYILQSDKFPTLFIMGDCVWDEATSSAVDKFRPDYIVVNSGGAIFPELSKDCGAAIPDEHEVMKMLDELPKNTKLIAVHMDAIDHCQTTRSILKNEARCRNVDTARLIIPEDGEKIVLY